MNKFAIGFCLVAAIALCNAEPIRVKKITFFQRQELEASPTTTETVVAAEPPYPPKQESAPYPPAGITPATPFELPTETTIAPQPAEEYGPPSQEYGPPAAPSQEYGPPAAPSQEYGPPAAPSQEYGPPATTDLPEAEETVVIEDPKSERIIIYRVPVAKRGKFVARLAKIISFRH